MCEAQSDICGFFENQTVFLTGVTGSLGKLILEKLLRTCNVKKVILLIRPKRGKSPKERINDLFHYECFDLLNSRNRNYADKVTVVDGDCSQLDLGLDPQDKIKIIKETNCIIHSAATVRFDEKLRVAAHINVRATQDLIEIAKLMPHLKSMVHISTAYSFCPLKDIDEKIYPVPMNRDQLFTLVSLLDDDSIEKILPNVLGDWPNTYVFTKAIAEVLVNEEKDNLPIAIIRPSQIVNVHKEPLPGWIDNFYVVIGISFAVHLGLLRTYIMDKSKKIEIVPVDYVVNNILAISWNTGSPNNNNNNEIPFIYNLVSYNYNTITYGTFNDIAHSLTFNFASSKAIWHSVNNPTKYEMIFKIQAFILHTIPAYVIDFIAGYFDKKPKAVEQYAKLNKNMRLLGYFAIREWSYGNENVDNLWKKMSKIDKELFFFNLKHMNWQNLIYVCWQGGCQFLLKERPETTQTHQRRKQKLKVIHYSLMIIIGLVLTLFVKLICYIF